MIFFATRVRVKDRGVPPESFLTELVAWGRSAPDEIFAQNSEPDDIYVSVREELGPYYGVPYRRSVMLEVMRVHAGFESSWNWTEGVDQTNKSSLAHKTGQETGIFQVSFDSEWIENGKMKPFAQAKGITDVDSFIPKMKSDHALALEYYARLVRINVKWAGPIVRREIHPWLSRASVNEFANLLSS